MLYVFFESCPQISWRQDMRDMWFWWMFAKVSTGTHRFPSMCLVAWCSWSWGASTPASRQMCDLAGQVTLRLRKVLAKNQLGICPSLPKSEKIPFMFRCLEFIYDLLKNHDNKHQLYTIGILGFQHRYLRSNHIEEDIALPKQQNLGIDVQFPQGDERWEGMRNFLRLNLDVILFL